MGLFSRKKKAASVGLYGKHPTAHDFVNLQASSASARQLDEWLSESLAASQQLIEGWDEVYANAPPVYLIQASAEAGKAESCLLGCLAPSRDRVGRRYPLVIFAELDPAALLTDYPIVPHCRFLEEVTALLQGRDRLSHEELLEGARSMHPPDTASLRTARARHEEYTRNTSAAHSFGRMFNFEDAVGKAQVGRALTALRETCRTIAPGRPLPSFGLRCPLGDSMGDSTAEHAGLWLDLIQRQLPGKIQPCAVWSDGGMVITFNRLSDKALTSLWTPGWQDESLCDLATTTMADEAGELGLDQLLSEWLS